MNARLDQVIVWLSEGRAVVQVEFYDTLGKLRREVFHRPTVSLETALDDVAGVLAERRIAGEARVRLKRGARLFPAPELQTRFLQALKR